MRALTVAPAAAGLAGDVTVPGDKSISHRALILGALAIGETRITGLLEGEDVRRTAAAVAALGAGVARDGAGTWRVEGVGLGGLGAPDDVLDMGNSGTAARLLAGVLAAHPVFAVMTGDASLRRRPMRRVTEPLAAVGARFLSCDGRLPMAIEGTGTPLPVDHWMAVASAQVKSALLFAGLAARGTSRVIEPVPTRDHTEIMLRQFGADVQLEQTAAGAVIDLAGRPTLRAGPVAVPGDFSSAAFVLVAALLVPGSRVTVRGVGLNPRRAGLLGVLREMGAAIAVSGAETNGGEPVGDLTVSHSALCGVDVPAAGAASMIDEYPILAVACAAARGRSRLRGLSELRVKESDRLAATAAMLAAAGVRVAAEGDDLLIEGDGPPAGGGEVRTLMDHRLAMSGVVLGLAALAPMRVDDIGFVETSFPGFVPLMQSLGARLG